MYINIGTERNMLQKIFRHYGMKIALDGKLADMIQGDHLLYDYESLYQTRDMRRRLGHRPIISANFQNITKLSSIAYPLLNHPLFGNLFKKGIWYNHEINGKVIQILRYRTCNRDIPLIVFILRRISQCRFTVVCKSGMRILLRVSSCISSINRATWANTADWS